LIFLCGDYNLESISNGSSIFGGKEIEKLEEIKKIKHIQHVFEHKFELFVNIDWSINKYDLYYAYPFSRYNSANEYSQNFLME